MESPVPEIVIISLFSIGGALFALRRALHHTWHIEVIRHELDR